MRYVIGRFLFIVFLVAAGIAWNYEILPTSDDNFFSTAEAVAGRPATPVSYAGVARRTTVRVATPGVGHGGPANRGGPVNRVGRR